MGKSYEEEDTLFQVVCRRRLEPHKFPAVVLVCNCILLRLSPRINIDPSDDPHSYPLLKITVHLCCRKNEAISEEATRNRLSYSLGPLNLLGAIAVTCWSTTVRLFHEKTIPLLLEQAG